MSASKKYFLLTIVLTSCLIFFFYGKIILSPNQYLFAPTGDGLTAYYNTSWHIEFDSSYTEFKGSNYPFGEHTVYSEYRLLISNSIKALGIFFPSIKHQNVAITNLSILFSILFCAIFIFLIFKELGVKKWLAVCATIGITFLAPQVGRFDNHLTLAYLNCFPMTWYLMIKFLKSTNQKKWTTLLFLNNLGWFFIHSYLGLIAALFSGSFWLVYFFKNKNWTFITNYLHFFIQVFFPLIGFMSFVKITDTHVGRTENPLGFLLYNAEPDDIFIPHHAPLKPLLDSFFDIHLKWEAWSYVGILTTSILLILLFHFGKKAFEQKRIYPKLNWMQDDHLKIAFPASLLCLIFAFGYPFKAFPILLEWIPLIKNFRTTGRFGWIFYFVATVSVTYVLQEYLEQLKEKGKPVIILLLISMLPLLYFMEGFAHHFEMSKKITTKVNVFEKENLGKDYLSALKKIDRSKYQAIIPLPFYYCGSENFSRPIHDHSSEVSKIFSYHTQLPLLAFDVGRTSIQESKKIVQVISPNIYKKLIINDLPSKKPFLIIESDELTDYEAELKDRSSIIFGTKNFRVREISKAELLQLDSTKLLSELEDFKISLGIEVEMFHTPPPIYNNILTTDSSAFFYQNNFNNSTSKYSRYSNGAFEKTKRGENELAKFDANTFEKNKTYVLSAWFFNGQNDALNDWFRFIVEERNPNTGEFKYTTCFPEFSEVIDGDWSLVEMDFQVDFPENEIRIITIGKALTLDLPLYIDDLMIREKGVDVFEEYIEYKGNLYVKKNNHYQKDIYNSPNPKE
ncbi:MAG: hypothetical protein AB8H03_16890 [Saprospiraceae bacterium]